MKSKLLTIIKATVLSVAILTTTVVPNNIISNSVEVEAATKVKLNYTKKTVETDSEFKLKVIGTKKKVKWSTSNPYIAVARSDGTVLTDGAGKCVITAKVNGKKYKCNVTVKDRYGNVSGNVTYHYNQYRGYVPNTGSIVILINGRYNFSDGRHSYDEIKDDELSGLSDIDIKYLNSNAIDKLSQIGIYATKVDGNGNFNFNHVPVATYDVLIISKETTTRGWFDYYDESISDASDEYYDNVAYGLSLPSWYDQKLRNLISKAVGYNAYASKEITVYENETTYVTHEFPYTYN